MIFAIIILSILITIVSVTGGYIIYNQFKELKKKDEEYKKQIEDIIEKNNNLTNNLNGTQNNIDTLSQQLIDTTNSLTTKQSFENEKVNIYEKLASGEFINTNDGYIKWCHNNDTTHSNCITFSTPNDLNNIVNDVDIMINNLNNKVNKYNSLLIDNLYSIDYDGDEMLNVQNIYSINNNNTF
jgi:hypothetical protein